MSSCDVVVFELEDAETQVITIQDPDAVIMHEEIVNEAPSGDGCTRCADLFDVLGHNRVFQVG